MAAKNRFRGSDELLSDPQVWIAFATLTALELVLGIDNIIFISILVDKLPVEKREMARRIGLFLIWKSTAEIHQSLEGDEAHAAGVVRATFAAVILQIMIVDLVFSLDSIITAVGMVDDLPVMVAAVVVSVALMMLFAGPIGRFVSDHPTVKMLALAFLVVVGVVLMAEGFGHDVPKGYVYFGMAFSLGAEMLNVRMRKHSKKPVQLHAQHIPGD